MLDHEINEFGRRLGLSSLALSQAGIASLRIEGIGTVSLERLERRDGAVLQLILAADCPEHDSARIKRLLTACSWRRPGPFPISGGWFRGKIMAMTAFYEEEATAAALDNALRYLADILA